MMARAINIKIIKFIFSKLLKKEAMFRLAFSNKEIIIPINIDIPMIAINNIILPF